MPIGRVETVFSKLVLPIFLDAIVGNKILRIFTVPSDASIAAR